MTASDRTAGEPADALLEAARRQADGVQGTGLGIAEDRDGVELTVVRDDDDEGRHGADDDRVDEGLEEGHDALTDRLIGLGRTVCNGGLNRCPPHWRRPPGGCPG